MSKPVRSYTLREIAHGIAKLAEPVAKDPLAPAAKHSPEAKKPVGDYTVEELGRRLVGWVIFGMLSLIFAVPIALLLSTIVGPFSPLVSLLAGASIAYAVLNKAGKL